MPSSNLNAAPFTLDEALAVTLTSPEGRALLADTAQIPGGAPERVLALRKRGVELTIAAGVAEILEARHRARGRFPDADRLFLTGEMLAQATSPGLAAFHAACLAPFATVADLGCGAGIDAIALARAGIRVTAIDRDPARLVFARANADACGIAPDQIRFLTGDVTTLDWEAEAVFWDPARRAAATGDRVSRHADRYEPPLSFLDAIRDRVRGGCLKLSPALPDDVLAALGGSVAFLSEDRTCKEACVRFGEAAKDAAPWTAALLPEGLIFPGSDPPGIGGQGGQSAPLGARGAIQPTPGAFVFDPDPAIIRADALGPLAENLQARRLSAADAYLTSDTPPASPAARRAASAYRVLAAMPYRASAVSAWLKSHGVGRLVVKKRHFDREPDAVCRELGLKGRTGDEKTLILVRRDPNEGGHLAVICEPDTAENPGPEGRLAEGLSDRPFRAGKNVG